MISSLLKLLERKHPDIRSHNLSITDMLLLHIASQQWQNGNENDNQDNVNQTIPLTWKKGLLESVTTNDWYAVLDSNPNRYEWLFSNISSSSFVLGYEAFSQPKQPEGFIVVSPGTSVGRSRSIVRFNEKDYGAIFCRAITGIGEREFLCNESSL